MLIALLIATGLVALWLGKLPQFIWFLITVVIFIKIALVAFFFFIIGLMLFRPRYCCRRC